jgi:hypothetical protein
MITTSAASKALKIEPSAIRFLPENVKDEGLPENLKDEGSMPLRLVAMDPVPRQLRLQQLQLKGMSRNQFGEGTIKALVAMTLASTVVSVR